MVYQFIYSKTIKEDEVSLASANRKIQLKQFEDAAEIYLKILEQEPDNDIALCNLGYIFNYGLDIPTDLNKARGYYSKSISYGNRQALRNQIAMELENDATLESYGSLFWKGIEEKDEAICHFVAASKNRNESIKINEAIDFCQSIDTIRSDDLWEWKYDGLEKIYGSAPQDTDSIRYIFASIGTETQGEYIANIYRIYRVEKRYCPYIDLLQAGFDETI